MSNDSYDLAEEYVTDHIEAEMLSAECGTGSQTQVPDMQNCDCVPVVVKDMKGRTFDLIKVEGRARRLVAIYEKR